jgi:sigma-B regulation protein RsbU (phosphoserine phosphatase)
VLYSGIVAIGWAYSFTRSFKVFPLVIIFQFGFHFIPWADYFPGSPETTSEIQSRLIFDGIGILICIILAYIALIRFITHEGIKQIALSTEMKLAGEMHRVLVPDIDIASEQFEITGRSDPTDEVGGDLIDLVAGEKETITYMIDVSGHGVGPGLLTGMFKASFRSLYETGKTLDSIVNNLNKVLLEQRKKGMFITFGGLRFLNDDRLEILLAGHPPIIKIDRHGHLAELKITTQLPLLTLRDSVYESMTFTTKTGDLFIIYSDGIIETTDKKGKEFGFDRLQQLLLENFSFPTHEISERIYKELNAYGASHDDQSLLVIRKK